MQGSRAQEVRERQVALNRELQVQCTAASISSVIDAQGGPAGLSIFNLLSALHLVAKLPAERSSAGATQEVRRLWAALELRLTGAEPDPEQAGEVRMQWLCRIAHAAAKAASRLGLRPEERPLLLLVARLAAERLEDLDRLQGRDAANLLWALGSARVAHEPLVESLKPHLLGMERRLSPLDVSNILWAFGRLGHCDDAVLQALSSTALRHTAELGPAGLSAVLGALAHLCRAVPEGRRPPGVDAFVSASATQLPDRLAGAGPSELAQICWAFAALAHARVETYDTITAAQASRSWGSLDPRDLSAMAWSLASVGLARGSVMRDIAQVAAPLAPRFDGQGMVNLCWALAHAGTEGTSSLFSAAGAAAAEAAARGAYTAQMLANLTWAFASQGFLDGELMASVAVDARSRLHEFQPAELSALLWAYAVLGVDVDESGAGGATASLAAAAASVFVHGRSAGSEPEPGHWTAREAGNVLWALAVLGHHDEATIARGASLLSVPGGAAHDAHLRQWYLAWLAHDLRCGSPPGVDPELVERCRRAAWRRAMSEQAGPNSSSALHREVSKEARSLLGPGELQDELVIRDCLVVDIGLPRRLVALEVDGPSHFAEQLRAGGPPCVKESQRTLRCITGRSRVDLEDNDLQERQGCKHFW